MKKMNISVRDLWIEILKIQMKLDMILFVSFSHFNEENPQK